MNKKTNIVMSPELQTYAREDGGFSQFCERYNLLAGDPDALEQYVIWFNEQLREAGMPEAARHSGWEEGLEQGLEQGQIKTLITLINRKKQMYKTREQIIDELGLDDIGIEILDNFDSYNV